MHRVLIHDAEYDDVQKVVDKVFELFPIHVSGKKVMIKPNALRDNPPEEAVTTHPAILKAVIRHVEKRNPSQIIVGDNPGAASYGANEKTFHASGLLEAAGKYYQNIGLNVRDRKITSRFYSSVSISKAIAEADVYISLPKFKTHGLTILSGAIKNNYGILPGAQKAEGHCLAGNPYNFNELIVDIFSLRIPDLIIVDGILAMEGNGPVSTQLKHVGKILASDNAVAIDATISRMMGYDPANLHFLQLAKSRGLGDFEAEKIDIIGKLKPVPGFALPPSALDPEKGMPAGAQDFMQRLARLRPQADHTMCTGCGTCVDECPVQALTLVDAYPEVDPEKCIACFCCQEKCPEKAIALQ